MRKLPPYLTSLHFYLRLASPVEIFHTHTCASELFRQLHQPLSRSVQAVLSIHSRLGRTALKLCPNSMVLNESTNSLGCEGPSGDALTVFNYCLISYFALTFTATGAILLFTYFEAKKKYEEIENAYGPGYSESSGDYSEDELYSEEPQDVDISDMYEVIPEDIQRKEERKRKRFGSHHSVLGNIEEDDDENQEEEDEEVDENIDEDGRDSGTAESGGSSRNPSDESVLDNSHLNRLRTSMSTEASDHESISNKSSRRTSDESDVVPQRPAPRLR